MSIGGLDGDSLPQRPVSYAQCSLPDTQRVLLGAMVRESLDDRLPAPLNAGRPSTTWSIDLGRSQTPCSPELFRFTPPLPYISSLLVSSADTHQNIQPVTVSMLPRAVDTT